MTTTMEGVTVKHPHSLIVLLNPSRPVIHVLHIRVPARFHALSQHTVQEASPRTTPYVSY